MVVQGVGARKAKVFLCPEDVRVEGAGKASRLHALYDWVATVTLVTHAAALKAGLERKRQVPAAIAPWSTATTWCRLLTATTW